MSDKELSKIIDELACLNDTLSLINENLEEQAYQLKEIKSHFQFLVYLKQF